jgi:hypothetical protein
MNNIDAVLQLIAPVEAVLPLYGLYMRRLITVSASSGSKWYTPTDLSTSAALGARVAAATACTHQDTAAAQGTGVVIIIIKLPNQAIASTPDVV